MKLIRPTDGMEITESLQLEPGTFHLPNGMRIARSGNVTLSDCDQVIVGHNLGLRGAYL